MFEKPPMPTAEQEPRPAEKLFAYISSLPAVAGVPKIQGQVQLRTTRIGAFLEGALYAPRMENGEFTFTVVNEEGVPVTYRSVDGSSRDFVTEAGAAVEAVFPGFTE